ncbi:MAG: ferrous iron transport protein A [Eubacterium sp.]|nr:ferrous iron transport protein A [Eubacterium sp.]
MNLNDAELGKEYVIKAVVTDGDDEMESFLFSLGCYSGEAITVVDKQKKTLVVSIKDARYSIDQELAAAIEI